MTDILESAPLVPEVVNKKIGPGRRAGGTNASKKKTGREICEEMKFDPIKLLIRIARTGFIRTKQDGGPWKNEKISNEERMKALRELASYYVPKLKSTEVTTKGQAVTLPPINLIEILSDPELCAAAQKMALLLAEGEPQKASD